MPASDTLTRELEPTRAQPMVRRPGVRVGAVVAVAAAVGLVLWLVLGGSDGKAPVAGNGQDTPFGINLAGLKTLARGVPTPVYWVGPRQGVTYELTRTSTSRVYVRYLPGGVKPGAGKKYLTVATYPLPQAYRATASAAARSGTVRIAVPGAAIAFYNTLRPESVYYAERGSDYQVEIFSPSPAQAHDMVAAGRVRAVAPKVSPLPRAATPAQLRAAAAALPYPVYWVGAKPGFTYELTQAESGRIYVRYLPAGAAIGSKKQYLTVGTYPFPKPFAAVRREAAKAGAQKILLSAGGLAVVDGQYPESVHVAYPGATTQIEVFDPAPGRARSLVSSGLLRRVP